MDSSLAVSLKLVLFPDELTVYRLPSGASVPPAIFSLPWYTISKTLDELSITLPSGLEVFERNPNVKEEAGWKCLKIDGVLDFELVGILAGIVSPLKEAKIPVFVISTFDTDYILIKSQHIENAKRAIAEGPGHTIVDCEVSLKK